MSREISQHSVEMEELHFRIESVQQLNLNNIPLNLLQN